MIKITSVAQLLVIKKNDIIINRSTGSPKRFTIRQVDDQKVLLMTADRPAALKMFPKLNLLSENWWLER